MVDTFFELDNMKEYVSNIYPFDFD